MPSNPLHLVSLLALGSLLTLAPAHAGIVRFNATINAAQETSPSTSVATGSAVMLYDVTSNTFDLTVTINAFADPLTNSHIHEAAAGVAGAVVVGFGAESVYVRTGNTLTATFTNLTYAGTPATLLSGGAYLNYHTTAFPAGAIRGQLIPVPVKLTAMMTPGQETGSVTSNAYGATQATYDPMTNMITTLVCVYRFSNTLANSHIHEAAVGVSGAVTLGFGAAANYIQSGTTYVQQFGPSVYPGLAVSLLSERAYVNVHSNVYGAGEIRGQLYVSNPNNAGRLVNVSARGQVGTGNNVLISGFYVNGTEPVRVLVTARGPSLASFISGTLADPMLALHDASGAQLITNNNVATAPFQTLITAFNGVSFTAAESGVLLVLPPGGYTGIVSGAGNTTGVGLAEAFEVQW